jgi:hypothetical protein
MAPRWPQVNNGPEHINEHATYLREACNQMQAIDRGRQNQVPWNIVQPYIASTIALIGKVLRQPAMSEILQQIQDTAKCTQNIQRDITVIKSSVGLSTTPLNAANFSGGRNATASWAQVAAQAKGSPLPPPPVPQGVHTTKTQPTVTAYKDRVVTVKLKDHGIVQRYRTHPAAWTRHQVETSIHNNAATKLVKVVAAHQLKSGDIQIFTSTTAEAIQLKENKGWIGGLGEQAELIVPTYGVIVHGISTNSINIKDQKTTIQQMLADNYTVIPRTEISYIGWLTKESTLKRASSIVVEFTDPEMANAIIYAGMVWDGHIHQCQLYDRACRVKQCFRCYNYGHIGTQCTASQVCGYCTEQHETKHCRQKGMEGFTPQCAVCKGAHTAWSNACPARKKELERVEQAKQARSIYWHVPFKENTARPRTYNIRNTNGTQDIRAPATTIPAQTTSQRSKEPTALGTSALVDIAPQALPPTSRSTDQLTGQTAPQAQTPIGAQTPSRAMSTRASVALSEEDWATPAMQQEQTYQLNPPIDPQILATQESFSFTQALEDSQPQPSVYPLDGIDGAFGTQDADTWLDNMINNDDSEWMRNTVEVAPSPPTSMATDTRTALGAIYRGCKCPTHQEIYSNWPTHNAELTIAQCMRTCVYCGKDFTNAAELRKHMKQIKYAQRNLSIYQETRGKHSSTTPAWTSIPTHRSDSEPLARPSNARTTRSQSITNSANGAPRPW